MKKVIIIDDEPLARNMVKEYLSVHKELAIAAECANGYEGVKAINEHHPDLIILDIQMPKITGFEMLELIEKNPHVIFATAFDEYAIRAFEANAVDYLLKPFSQERFDKAIEKWKEKLKSGKEKEVLEKINETPHKQPGEAERIVVRNNSEIFIVPLGDVHYIEAYDDYVKIFTEKNYYLKKKTMNYYESVLNENDFFRTHRSFIINLKQLTRIEPMEKNTYLALLRSGKKIPLSRAGYLKLKEKLGI